MKTARDEDGRAAHDAGNNDAPPPESASENAARDTLAPTPLLSLVIPAYNERHRLPRSLKTVRRYLERQSIAAEVIVVDDGSTDGGAEIIAHRAMHWPALRLIRTAHQGKGGAVRAGLLAARGEYSFICDADFSMPITEIPKFLPPQLPHPEVAIAVREGPQAHRYGEPYHRHLMGRVYNTVVKTLALPGIQDSQCGFKLIRTDIAQRMARAQTLNGWGFDVELLFLARRWGYRIDEVGIHWYYAPSSRVSPIRDSLSMTRDVLTVRRNARAGVYDRPTEASAETVGQRSGESSATPPQAPVEPEMAARAAPATPARERTAR